MKNEGKKNKKLVYMNPHLLVLLWGLIPPQSKNNSSLFVKAILIKIKNKKVGVLNLSLIE